MKKIKLPLVILLTIIILMRINPPAFADFSDDVDARSAILMEASSGMILYEKNADEPLPPASVTKIMTLLLVMEAIDSGKIKLDDMVVVSDNAASMGGSQVYLEAGEQMTVEDMIKSVVISSANDAAVALAEHIAGSEAFFVSMMNEKAAILEMTNTHFENTNGLDDMSTSHLCSAKDIAIMSRELLRHEKILDYTKIWQDTIRDGAFTLSNTNRLIRFYNGANGLKTGSTSKAKFCISATAKRDNMQLICVIMGSPTRDIRNEEAKKLLDYGFANYGVYSYEQESLGKRRIVGSKIEEIELYTEPFSCVIDKGQLSKIEKSIEISDQYTAPVKAGECIGKVIFTLDGKKIGESEVLSQNSAEKITYNEIFMIIISRFSSIK